MLLKDYITSYGGSLKKAEFYNGTIQAEFLKTIHPPSPHLILLQQKRMFQQLANLYNFNDPAIIELNNDLMGKFVTNNYNFDHNISKIEQYVRALNANSPEKVLEQVQKLEPYIGFVDQLVQEFVNFFNNLNKLNSMKEISYALKPIYNKLKQLESIAQSITQGELGSCPTGTLCGRISWCEYIIKGQYLEAKGKEFIAANVPSNFKVIQTGQIKGQYDIFGNFKNNWLMKEDLMILDSDNFLISFTLGKNNEVKKMTLKDFMNFLENRTSTEIIRLTQAGYDALVSHLVSGVQAKATLTNKIRFGKVNIRNQQGGQQEKALLTLKEIYKAQRQSSKQKHLHSFLKNTHNDYQALFNYNLSHYLGYIVGKNNKLLLTRTGLQDMYGFIMEQFKANRYFYGLEDFKLSSDAGISVGLDFSDKT